jgi:hypothetical protein
MPPGPNPLKNRDADNIEETELGFSTGQFNEAMRSSPAIERRAPLTPHEFDIEYRREGKP